jgi:hypothetical protein
MAGKAIGGVIVFGGGLPLYANDRKIVGGLGLSGDTSCTDQQNCGSGVLHPTDKDLAGGPRLLGVGMDEKRAALR